MDAIPILKVLALDTENMYNTNRESKINKNVLYLKGEAVYVIEWSKRISKEAGYSR